MSFVADISKGKISVSMIKPLMDIDFDILYLLIYGTSFFNRFDLYAYPIRFEKLKHLKQIPVNNNMHICYFLIEQHIYSCYNEIV